MLEKHFEEKSLMCHLGTSFMNNNFILGSSVVQDYTVPARTNEGQMMRFEKIRSLEDNRKVSRREMYCSIACITNT